MPEQYEVKVDAECTSDVSLWGRAVKAGLSIRKGWFQEFWTRTELFHDRNNEPVIRTQSWKRKAFGNWYSERITMKDTGEIVHVCEEPLTDHHNKPKAKNSTDLD